MARQGTREDIVAVLEKDGSSLDDYDSTIFVVVDGWVLEDSVEVESEAVAQVDKAEGYGEINCFYYIHKVQED